VSAFGRERVERPVIVGFGATPIGHHPDRSPTELGIEALEEALARAVASHALVAASAGVSAAHYHHKAVQSDYFPKVGAYLVNLHYNKFMGQTIQLFSRVSVLPTVSRAVPLFDKDQTFVGPTVTQPLTPLFKVHEAVRIAKADERIARAKANAAAGFRATTRDLEERFTKRMLFADNVATLGQYEFVFGKGGVPLVDNGRVVGAVGVSGAVPADNDHTIADAAAGHPVIPESH
jgi:hypothetical protein